MAGNGYSFVSPMGFIAFRHDLAEGEWKNVVIKKYDAADQMPSASLLEAPRIVTWKLRACWALDTLSEVLGAASAEVLAELDRQWDSTQRRAYHFLGAAVEDKDVAKREAAVRLSAVLLAGNGTAQIIFSHDDEVDFGRQQVELASKGSLADDAKAIGLAPLLKEIQATTEALAKGLGRGPGQKRAGARSRRLRDAMAACSVSFNAIHDELAWTGEHTPAGATRKLLEDLRAPFEALLARFPPPATAEKGEDVAADGDEADETKGDDAAKPG